MDKKLIFTVTPGRSGTAYLAKLLDAVPSVNAHHEPQPNFVDVMRRVQMEPAVAYAFLYKYKIPAIRACPGEVYAETSHLTCKGFIEPMIRMGLRPALIILRRPPREVAWSHGERGAVPGRSTSGVAYLLDPRDLGVLPLLHWEAASHYQLCFWYALEMERRQLHYAEMAHDLGLPVIDVTHRELNDWAVFAQILTTLGLPVSAEVRQAHSRISSERHNKNPLHLDMLDHLEVEEEPIWENIAHFEPLLRDHIARRYGGYSVPAIGSALPLLKANCGM